MNSLTSIVILTRNELACTKACVESIHRHTPQPYELIFVDNGSSDGTLEYLHGLPTATTTVIVNDTNHGFGGGCNQGIAAARGDRILLLNNDTVVTAGWLGALHHQLDVDERVGLVGPRSNRVAGEQQVDAVGYDVDELDGLDQWAEQFTQRHRGQAWPLTRLIGFCILLRREVIDEIGGFDLRFGLGNFEDDDLCMRAAVAGWRAVVADDCYIHHFGSRTFAAERIDYQASLLHNWRVFIDAWKIPPEEIGSDGTGYRPDALIRRTAYDRARHYAPLIAQVDRDSEVAIERRGVALLVMCDRTDAAVTKVLIEAPLRQFSSDDDLTVVVCVDPRDERSIEMLEQVADRIESDGHTLPDLVIVSLRDDDATPVLRVVDAVVTVGAEQWALQAHARHLGVAPVGVHELARYTMRSAPRGARDAA